MSDQTNFSLFIKFVTVDQQILNLSKQLSFLKVQVDKYFDKINQLKDQILSGEHRIDLQKKQIKTLELETKIIETDLKSKISKLEKTSGLKEYRSLETEISSLQNRRSSLDDQLLELIGNLDNENLNFEKIKLENQKEQSAISSQIKNLEAEESQINQKIESLSLEKAELQNQIPKDFLSKFLHMKQTIENPVVKVENNACGACHVTLTSADINSLRHHKLIQCRECFRLLYL